jgi:hypothetical protein
MNLAQQKSSLEILITNALKARVKQLGLVDTGKLVGSIKCTLQFTSAGFDVNVDGVDYFKYLDGDYNIVDFVLSSKFVSDAITNLYADMVLNEL